MRLVNCPICDVEHDFVEVRYCKDCYVEIAVHNFSEYQERTAKENLRISLTKNLKDAFGGREPTFDEVGYLFKEIMEICEAE